MNRYLHRMGIICIVSTAVLAAMAAGLPAADESWTAVEGKKQLVVGFCAQYPPFEFKNEAGRFEGVDVDLGHAIGRKLGVEIIFKDGEWQGLIAGMKRATTTC